MPWVCEPTRYVGTEGWAGPDQRVSRGCGEWTVGAQCQWNLVTSNVRLGAVCRFSVLGTVRPGWALGTAP